MIRAASAFLLLLCATDSPADTLNLNGTTRTYAMIAPQERPAPLVLVLHGNTQQGIDMQTRSSWPQLARRQRFVAVFPDGLNRAWADLRSVAERVGRKPPAGTDDVAFLTALVAKYIKDGTADPKRIYVTGVSNGGAMAMTLACAQPQVFAAAAAVIMSLTEAMAAACKPAQPTPMLVMNGTADPLVAYAGGKATSRFGLPKVWSTKATIAFWRRINGCEGGDGPSTDLPDNNRSDSSTVTRIASRCPPGQDVVLYQVNGGGHRMPGRNSDARMPRVADALFGPQNHDIDGPEVIWGFLQTFTR